MSKVGKDIIAGLEAALAHAKGDASAARIVPPSTKILSDLDVARIRKETGMSQSEFALAFMISVRTLQDWEQGRRRPDGPAVVLLSAIRRDHKAMLRLIGRETSEAPAKRKTSR